MELDASPVAGSMPGVWRSTLWPGVLTDGRRRGNQLRHPRGYYVTAADAKRVFPGLNPGSPKFCGLEIVSGSHLPDDWQGNLITNDFRGHLSADSSSR